MAARVLAETKYLRLLDDDGWSYVERPNLKGVVTIIPITPAGSLLFVEQVRLPVRGPTIEFPAGLAGDVDADEDLAASARRELIEETGWDADEITPLLACATSPGMTTEMVSFFLATKLRRVGPGGGVDDENIIVHEVPLDGAAAWLRGRAADGRVIAAKVWAGLYFAWEHVRSRA